MRDASLSAEEEIKKTNGKLDSMVYQPNISIEAFTNSQHHKWEWEEN